MAECKKCRYWHTAKRMSLQECIPLGSSIDCKYYEEAVKIPECCGRPVEIYELYKGNGEWVAHCKNCWDGTSTQNSREDAIEAWERECV